MTSPRSLDRLEAFLAVSPGELLLALCGQRVGGTGPAAPIPQSPGRQTCSAGVPYPGCPPPPRGCVDTA